MPRVIPDGTPIRPKRLYSVCLGLGLLATAALAFELIEPRTRFAALQLAAAELAFAIVGVTMLVMTIAGKLPRGHLQLDASGITFDFVLWSCTVPWQRIGRVEVSWSTIRLFAGDLATLAIDPPEQRERALRRMSAADRFGGTPFIIVPLRYRLPKTAFLEAIERHRSASHARD